MEKKYAYVSTAIAEVMNNIEEFIIPENRRIIEYLWDKNILTTQTNNYENDYSWISIGELSEENNEIFWNLANEMANKDERIEPKFTIYKGLSVPIIPGSKDTFDDFKPLVDMLRPQDVQKDGYMTKEEFFINYTDCWKVIDNPEYEKISEPEYEDYTSILEYQKACEAYIDSISKRKIKVIDESKVTKPIEEYLNEAGYSECYDEEEGKIFYNRRLYEGHMRYKEHNKIK